MENKTKITRILQICRLTPLWGMDLFKEMTNALQSNQFKVTTVFLSGAKNEALQYTGNIIFLELNRFSAFWRLKAFFKLLKLTRENNFDIVICHDYKPTLIMYFVTLFQPVKQCYSVYHTFQNFRKRSPKFFLNRLKKKWTFLTVSDALGKEIQALNVPPEKIMTLHNTIDMHKLEATQYSREISREKLNIPQDVFVFGTLGRFVKEKGQSCLIDAFAQSIFLKEKNVFIIMIGTGPLEEKLKEQIKSYHLDNKILLITQHAKEGARFLKAFDVFVLPSLQEAFGISLLEATCAKLPIIANDVGGIPEAVGNHGFLIPPKDVTALQQAMEKYYAMHSQERIALGNQGYEFTKNHFDLPHYYRNIQMKLG